MHPLLQLAGQTWQIKLFKYIPKLQAAQVLLSHTAQFTQGVQTSVLAINLG